MTITTTLNSAIAAAALTLAVAAQAEAESTFGTLAGIDAEPMNAQEMDAVQGKAFYYDGLFNLFDVNRVVYTFDWSCLECGLSYYRFIDPTGDAWYLSQTDMNQGIAVLRNPRTGAIWDGGFAPGPALRRCTVRDALKRLGAGNPAPFFLHPTWQSTTRSSFLGVPGKSAVNVQAFFHRSADLSCDVMGITAPPRSRWHAAHVDARQRSLPRCRRRAGRRLQSADQVPG